MTVKALDAKAIADLARYTDEELDPNAAENTAEVEAFIARNRAALNQALAEGYVSLENGEGTPIRSLEELLLALNSAPPG